MPDRRNEDTPLQALRIRPADRASLLGQRPFVVWLTGLSGAGKSTLADRLDMSSHSHGLRTAVLDGDNLRRGINADLGFTADDRSENVRRVAHIAALMADAGLIVIVSLISPYRSDRSSAREIVGAERFIEVFVDAPLHVCAKRDPKGMYARARAGSLHLFTGVGSDYECPEQPDVHIRTDRISPDEAADLLLKLLQRSRPDVAA